MRIMRMKIIKLDYIKYDFYVIINKKIENFLEL